MENGNGVDRRAARRFLMTLPMKVRFSAESGVTEKPGETRDVSFRGLYFLIEAAVEAGGIVRRVLDRPEPGESRMDIDPVFE